MIGLLAGVLVLIRKGWLPAGLGGLSTLHRGDKRLSVTEHLILDPRRRVVIIKADDREHVVLLGPERELVLQSMDAPEDIVFEPDFSEDYEDTDANEDSSRSQEQAS